MPFKFFSSYISPMHRYSFLIVVLLLAGCGPSPVYQRSEGVPGLKWASSFKPKFSFQIEDTAATYNLSFLIRHTEAYPFSNIWLQFSIQGPADSVARSQRIEIPLAAESGQWYGRGMNEIWEQRMPISTERGPNITFPKSGRYTVQFQQVMRTNPLPEVMNIGLRVEKIGVPVSR